MLELKTLLLCLDPIISVCRVQANSLAHPELETQSYLIFISGLELFCRFSLQSATARIFMAKGLDHQSKKF